MQILTQFVPADSVPQSILVLATIITLGLALGSLRIFRLSLGVAGVLFAGLIFGHFKVAIHSQVLEFARDFGLVIFVFMVGMQVGPGFFDSFKREGLSLNLLAVCVVAGDVFIAFLLKHFSGIPPAVVIGLLSGATTNTPSLAAAQQALKQVSGLTPEILKMPALGYAVAYPFGVLGIILTIVAMRLIFRINPTTEAEQTLVLPEQPLSRLTVGNFKVENPNLNGLPIKKIPALNEMGVTISRVMHGDHAEVALRQTKIYLGDVILAVGPQEKLDNLAIIVGTKSNIDLREVKSNISSRHVLVTRPEVVGRSIVELDIRNRYGVTISRVIRGEVDFVATADIKLRFADTLVVVGEQDSIKKFASDMGNSLKRLNYPDLIPVFIGIALGVLVGSWPFYIMGIPTAFRLGLAGGPLAVSIILSRMGRLGPLVWYIPPNANFILREIGIAMFLACVGLRSGDEFVSILVSQHGLYWIAGAALITLTPLLIVGICARLRYKTNFFTLSGLLSGSMTDPPALAFASQMADTNAAAVSYAQVYPLVMLLRVISIQVLVAAFFVG